MDVYNRKHELTEEARLSKEKIDNHILLAYNELLDQGWDKSQAYLILFNSIEEKKHKVQWG
jgi:hypothetical protein